MTTTAPLVARPTTVTTKQRVGLVLGLLYGLSNVPSAFLPSNDPGTDGPPYSIMVVDSLLGVLAAVCCVLAWRGNRVAQRIAAGAIILITLSSLPALFVDVPMAVKAIVAFGVLLTVLIVALMFSGPRRAEQD
jgi:hypothetical protein